MEEGVLRLELEVCWLAIGIDCEASLISEVGGVGVGDGRGEGGVGVGSVIILEIGIGTGIGAV